MDPRSRPERLLLLTVLALWGGMAGSARAQLHVSPVAVVLDGPESTQQLLVMLKAGGTTKDVTRNASYSVANGAIARVDSHGLVEPLAEGSTHLSIRQGNSTASVTLQVTGLRDPKPVSFEQQVIPLLTKATCNSGGCHGKAEGQNGFKLSVFGFDPDADHAALTREGRGRRVLASAPGDSLLVQKAIAKVPHGGGRKIQEGSLPHRRLTRWMAEGMRDGNGGFVPEARIEVEPERVVLEPGAVQQLRVTAVDA
ncbi:MAG: Ig domain-containing protein, partial [Gemmataceae bacterium]